MCVRSSALNPCSCSTRFKTFSSRLHACFKGFILQTEWAITYELVALVQSGLQWYITAHKVTWCHSRGSAETLCWWTWEVKARLTSIEINGELIERLCGVCCVHAGLVNNATSARAIKQTAFTAQASHAFILWLEEVKHVHTHTHTHARAQGWWWLTSSHFINLLPRFRLSDTRTGLSWSAWTPGWAPAIQASTFTPKAAQKKSQESLSFFSGKKPERSALDDSGTVVVNGNALCARMVI